MRGLWVYYLLWESLPILKAYPLSSTTSLSTNESLKNWEINWLKYTIGLGIAITAFTLVGCLCCRRNRRLKGFQEFKDGGSIENDASISQLQGLELQVPTNISLSDRIQFEPLPVERFVPEIYTSSRPKPLPPTPSLFEEETGLYRSTVQNQCNEWFQKTDLHVPREKLKYLREIGHGWFGKVVEGCAELQGTNLDKCNTNSGNVVVRILTEEATSKEKAWFLGEATPYLKLRHRNILSLFGFCLETDPYLLLFESCPLGDLKSFLRNNYDPQSRKTLINENMPTRIAIEIGAGLRHMHEHGLTHTDLSARNCLVASDLSIKLGDYGTGVEKYPGDYYILGDRALPIRWSAPETIECTETTVETREITPRANFWSYGVLLWEIAMWGKRPYDELEDEKVIKMLLSSKSGLKPVGSQLLLQSNNNYASNLLDAIKSCLILEPNERFALEKVRHVLLKDQLEAETSEFDQRWMTLRPNNSKDQMRSASLQDLRGSIDSEQWPSLTQTSFRLGPEEPVKNVPGGLTRNKLSIRDSDSETEEESWRGRVERGAYTEKVKQKSKSVADLMVLVHIEPDSDADLSLGPQVPIMDKSMLGRKRLSAIGSDGDLPSAVFDDQFNFTLRKLRDPLLRTNSLRCSKNITTSNNTEKLKLLNLSMDQGQTQILKQAFDSKAVSNIKEIFGKDLLKPLFKQSEPNNLPYNEKVPSHLSKENTNHSVHRYNGEIITTINKVSSLNKTPESQSSMSVDDEYVTPSHFSNNFEAKNLVDNINIDKIDKNNDLFNKMSLTNVDVWNNTPDAMIEKKSVDFNTCVTPSPIHKINATIDEAITPSPQSRTDYSTEDAEDVEDEFSNAEDLPGLSKRNLAMDEEDDRKRMSTPDDERSSDSGFRDKESCEEEESPLPRALPTFIASQPNTPKSPIHDSSEEEQLRILFELDTILDAEYSGTLNESLDIDKSIKKLDDSNDMQKDNDLETESSDTIHSSSNITGETQKEIIQSSDNQSNTINEDINMNAIQTISENSNWINSNIIDNNEDEDSSTMSLRSDNSYVSFGMDEEFATTIRNELREKLPRAQTAVLDTQEPCSQNNSSFVSVTDRKKWEDEAEELSDRSDVLDISISYNTYGTPLSPILEERESATNSESANLTRSVSLGSKYGNNLLSEDDVLLIDTQTNRATLVEGVAHSQDLQDLSNRAISDNDNQLINTQRQNMRQSFPLDNRFSGIVTGNSGAPLPSPEDECCKWEQMLTYPILPLQLQDNLMSTSFASEQDWSSDDEDQDRRSKRLTNEIDGEDNDEYENNENEDDYDDDDDDEGEDGVIDENDDDDIDDEEDSSSSSGEFIWQQCSETHLENHETEILNKNETNEANIMDNDPDEDIETEEDEEEFTPSAWDATLAPHRSALRSPDKTLKSGDQKKSVWFKKQRYHCVYEYPKETPSIENQSSTTSVWEPTSYTDWEEMIDNIDRLNFQPMDCFENNNTRGDEEFYVSSSNRPFQFQSGNGKFVSQFFPGARGNGDTSASQDTTSQESQPHQSDGIVQQQFFSDRQQLGELRHTRDRLKLNLLTSPPTSSNGSNSSSSANSSTKATQLCIPVMQGMDLDDKDELGKSENESENTSLEKNSTKSDEDIRLQSEPLIITNQEIFDTTTTSETEPPVVHIKMSPSDEQISSGSLESKTNYDDLDVD